MGEIRKIIHLDCDCFYAAAELLRNPQLINQPIAVGGSSKSRGVIATCNYPARQFGVRSAISSAMALRLCPQLILLPADIDYYRQISQRIFALYRRYTTLIEPLSLDEAYLDVTGLSYCQGSASLLAEKIRQQVFQQEGITVSAGVAPNKFLAKIASDWHKPNGIKVIPPEGIADFVAQLPINKLFGVGKVTAQKIEQLGAYTCVDLQKWSIHQLISHFGVFGSRLYELCRGIDNRPVQPNQERKSFSVEQTFPQDLSSLTECQQQLLLIIEQFFTRYQTKLIKNPIHKLFVKVKFNNFVQTTSENICHQVSREQWLKLLEQAYQRHKRPVRLLGVGVKFGTKIHDEIRQYSLFNA